MENEIFNKNNINYINLIISKNIIIKKRNGYFLKSIIIIILMFLLLISQFRKSYNSIKETLSIENTEKSFSNVININYAFYFFENKLKELQKSFVEWPLPSQIKFKPLMSKRDLMGFLSFMKPNLTYFEFGSGGSTNVASYYRLKVYSVESDALWHNKLKNSNINATYITIDLKVIKAGYPGNHTTIKDWKKYFQAYDSKYNADIILIDGRFRIICGLDIFTKIRNDTLVLIHDYENRDSYHILEKYYIKVRKWDSLSAFFKNPNITSIPQKVYNKYIYDKKI